MCQFANLSIEIQQPHTCTYTFPTYITTTPVSHCTYIKKQTTNSVLQRFTHIFFGTRGERPFALSLAQSGLGETRNSLSVRLYSVAMWPSANQTWDFTHMSHIRHEWSANQWCPLLCDVTEHDYLTAAKFSVTWLPVDGTHFYYYDQWCTIFYNVLCRQVP